MLLNFFNKIECQKSVNCGSASQLNFQHVIHSILLSRHTDNLSGIVILYICSYHVNHSQEHSLTVPKKAWRTMWLSGTAASWVTLLSGLELSARFVIIAFRMLPPFDNLKKLRMFASSLFKEQNNFYTISRHNIGYHSGILLFGVMHWCYDDVQLS
jgi:hypothetical protein